MARIYDVVMTHKLDADDFFIHRVQELCAARRLSFFLIEPLWVERFRECYAHGEAWARVLINMHSEHHQPLETYHRLVRLAAERQTRVIDPPDTAIAAFDKARLHTRLLTSGLTVPFTVIVPQDQAATFRLSEAERAALGAPFVIKPSMGYGRRGVVLDAAGEPDIIHSIAEWPDAHYLLQRRIVPRDLGGEPAYFRVFFVFGSVWCCWWNCFTDRYRLMTEDERARHGLDLLEAIIRKLASLTGMNFFSSEMALTEAGEFVLIDYVNDQCHMLSQSADPRIGVPDTLVAAIAARLVEAAHQMIQESRSSP
jgi:hypothetical protein